MTAVFLKLINMSISASWLVLAVIMLRFVLQKGPKWVNVLLWGIVAIRLICPFSIESSMSLIPSAETLPDNVISGPDFDVQTGIVPIDNQINDYLGDHYFEGVTVPVNNGANVMEILTIIWLIGIIALIAYTAISYWNVHRKVGMAILLYDNIFQSENVGSPFVLGIVKPRIYLPLKIDANELNHVIAHEQAHIKRRDHWWKPLAFLLLTIYWFNPIIWLAYILLCRDIELACDEKVIKELDNEQKANYSQALLACSISRRMISACPIAFGEVGVKNRIKSILNYKKPAPWIILISIIVCVIIAVCFLTNPVQPTIYDITGQNGYRVLYQDKVDFMLTIPKSVLSDDIYTSEGHDFEKNEVVAHKTETTTVYLDKVMLSNEGDDLLYFIFDFDYDIPAYGRILSPHGYDKGVSHGFTDVICLYSDDLRDIEGVFPDSVALRGHGPGTQFAFYVSAEACKEANGYLLIHVSCAEITYAKDGFEEKAQVLLESTETPDTLYNCYDFDHDGITENVELYSYREEDPHTTWYKLLIRNNEGLILWEEHAGYNSLFACTLEGKDYLLQYSPVMYHGFCDYSYCLFSLDADGNPNIALEDSISFDINFDSQMHNEFAGTDLADFMDDANGLLSESQVLINTYPDLTIGIDPPQDNLWWLQDEFLYSGFTYDESLSMRENLMALENLLNK